MIMVIQVAAIGYAVLPRRLRIFNKALFASDAVRGNSVYVCGGSVGREAEP